MQRSSCVTIKKAKCSLRGKRKGRFHFTVLASVDDFEQKVCVANRNIGEIYFTILFWFAVFIFSISFLAVRISLLF